MDAIAWHCKSDTDYVVGKDSSGNKFLTTPAELFFKEFKQFGNADMQIVDHTVTPKMIIVDDNGTEVTMSYCTCHVMLECTRTC